MPPRPLPVLPGVYLARVIGSWEGLPSTNLFCLKNVPPVASGSPDVAAAQAVAFAISVDWAPFAAAAFPPQYVATEVSCYPLNTPTAPAQVVSFSAPGENGTEPAVVSTSVLIKHVVDRRGRGSQGRTFLSPVPSGSVTADGKSVVETTRTLIETQFGVFTAGVVSALSAMPGGAWSFDQLSKVGTGASYPILSSTVEGALSTQRRRVRRNG